MYLDSILLKNFRNHIKLNIDFDKSTNLIIGKNGSGKTSIIEAINILSNTKSFKTSREIDLINFKSDVANILGRKINDKEGTDLEVVYQKISNSGVRKGFLIDKVPKRTSNFISSLYTVLFTTDLINNFTDKPSTRRKFFNQFLCQLDKDYLIALSTFEKIIRNKTRLLKMVKFGSDPYVLEYWNEELIRYASILNTKRSAFINRLQKFLSDSNKNIEVKYITKHFSDAEDIEEIKKKIKDDLIQLNRIEIEASRCLVGSHKDDYEVYMNNKNIKNFASRGEQKYTLSLLLYSIGKYICKEKNSSPVILLDDLGAEMDRDNLKQILDLFSKTDFQIIITGIEEDKYKDYTKKLIYLDIGIEDI